MTELVQVPIKGVKVYIIERLITRGMYGCREIAGVCSTKEDAEKKIFELSSKFDYVITEHIVE